MKITEKRLLAAGFEKYTEDGEAREYFDKGDISIWFFEGLGDYWVVDVLESMNVEFRTMEHLEQFFKVCNLDLYSKDKP